VEKTTTTNMEVKRHDKERTVGVRFERHRKHIEEQKTKKIEEEKH
jgi:hypothetical protein